MKNRLLPIALVLAPAVLGLLARSAEFATANGVLTAFAVKAWDGALASADPPVPVRVNVAASNDPPTLTNVTILPGGMEDTDFTISYATLANAADEADVDGEVNRAGDARASRPADERIQTLRKPTFGGISGAEQPARHREPQDPVPQKLKPLVIGDFRA